MSVVGVKGAFRSRPSSIEMAEALDTQCANLAPITLSSRIHPRRDEKMEASHPTRQQRARNRLTATAPS